MDQEERNRRAGRARRAKAELAARGVVGVAGTWVDNSGVTRVKAVPLSKLESAAAWGIGASPVFDAFLFNDVIISGRYSGGPVGDLRLHPDLDRLTVLSAQPGWAWAPCDRYDQNGVAHPQDQRTRAREMVERLAAAGYRARAAFEIEWVVGELADEVAHGADDFRPAVSGPGYGFARLTDRSDYLRDLLVALAEQGVAVDQIHPEYAPGQLELSVAAEDPVAAADTYVLVRETIRAVTARHGMRASFSPKVLADGVGNGGHVHISLWRDATNLFSGGAGTHGMTTDAASFTAGILDRLTALLAVGAPTVASYLRLVPHHWAGAFACWGLENREAALRLVTGAEGSQSWAANLEVKCFDQTANPYLALASLIAAGLAGIAEGATLPDPVQVDPASLDEVERRERGIVPLPTSLGETVTAFEADTVLGEALGEELAGTIVDLRRAEIAQFAEATAEEVAARTRWTH